MKFEFKPVSPGQGFRSLLFCIAILMDIASANSIIGTGFKVGLNLAKISGMSIENERRLGFAIGGYLNLDFGLPLFIQSELLLSQKGYRHESLINVTSEAQAPGSYTNKWVSRLNYLDMTILGVYPIIYRFHVIGGLSFSPFLNGKWKREVIDIKGAAVEYLEDQLEYYEGEGDYDSGGISGIDIGLILGAKYHLHKASLEVRFNLGLRDVYIATDGQSSIEIHNVIQILAGFVL